MGTYSNVSNNFPQIRLYPLGLPTIEEEAPSTVSRRPALERLSQTRTPALQRLGGLTSDDSGHFEEVEVHYANGNESTFVENRSPALLRINATTDAEVDSVQITIPKTTKGTARKRNSSGQTSTNTNRKRIADSSLQGASSCKRNAARILNPLKKKAAPDRAGTSNTIPVDRDLTSRTQDTTQGTQARGVVLETKKQSSMASGRRSQHGLLPRLSATEKSYQ
ncbi:unnamed protein product [Arabis nemorensis]|uniref:Uncharacterized protein n=1 Tax=Arabis nemorensis TaxID=586526 RepID=A0A565BRI8_9BRAS|nr:unnamed protein product [Arabis nemorensis]